MSKIVVSVIGLDCPGVVYAVSSTLSALECNIEEVSQTILKNQFAAIFVANKQESLDIISRTPPRLIPKFICSIMR